MGVCEGLEVVESLQLAQVEPGLEAGLEHWFHARCPWVPAWVVPEGMVGMAGQLVPVLVMLVAVRLCVRLPAAAAVLVFALLVVHGYDGPSEAFA